METGGHGSNFDAFQAYSYLILLNALAPLINPEKLTYLTRYCLSTYCAYSVSIEEVLSLFLSGIC